MGAPGDPRHAQAERPEPHRQRFAEAAHADDARPSAEQRSAHRRAPGAAAADFALGFGEAAAERDRRHDAPFGDRFGVAAAGAGGAGDGNAARGRRRDVDAFQADAPLLDQPQAADAVHQRAVDARHRRDEDVGGGAVATQRRLVDHRQLGVGKRLEHMVADAREPGRGDHDLQRRHGAAPWRGGAGTRAAPIPRQLQRSAALIADLAALRERRGVAVRSRPSDATGRCWRAESARRRWGRSAGSACCAASGPARAPGAAAGSGIVTGAPGPLRSSGPGSAGVALRFFGVGVGSASAGRRACRAAARAGRGPRRPSRAARRRPAAPRG